MAPYCAIPRDHLGDTPLACALWGFWCLNMANRVRYPLPFSERFPLGVHAKWRCDTPPLKRGISAILPRYPMKTRQMGAIPPLCDTISKGYCAVWGGTISHWAAKCVYRISWRRSGEGVQQHASEYLQGPTFNRRLVLPTLARLSQNWTRVTKLFLCVFFFGPLKACRT